MKISTFLSIFGVTSSLIASLLKDNYAFYYSLVVIILSGFILISEDLRELKQQLQKLGEEKKK